VLEGAVTTPKRFPKRRFVIASIITIIILAAAATLLILHLKADTLDIKKIDSVKNSTDCSTGLQELKSQKVDPKRVADSITLLRYRSTCLIEAKKYTEALSTLQQLKIYYAKEKNQNQMVLLEGQITGLKYTIAHPNQAVVNKNPLPTELQQSIDQLRAR